MNWLEKKRINQVRQYGWRDAKEIAPLASKSRLAVWFDIISCFKKYYVFSNQYKAKEAWKLNEIERDQQLRPLGEKNRYRDDWTVDKYSVRKFLYKYSGLRYDTSPNKYRKRLLAFKKKFNMGDNCSVSYNVLITRQHYSDKEIHIGNNVTLSRDVDIDFTGGLFIEDNVVLSEGTKILTHSHPIDYMNRSGISHGAIYNPLIIRERVSFGSRSTVLPGVNEIGRGALISAGSIVKKQVPPYAIVAGNPAMIVGFRYTPDQILEVEEDEYLPENRLPEELLINNYKKYYLDKLPEIINFLRR